MKGYGNKIALLWTRLKFWPHIQHYPKREALVWVVFSENSVPKQFLSTVLLAKAPIENKQNSSKQVKFSLPMWGLYINTVLGTGVKIWACFQLYTWLRKRYAVLLPLSYLLCSNSLILFHCFSVLKALCLVRSIGIQWFGWNNGLTTCFTNLLSLVVRWKGEPTESFWPLGIYNRIGEKMCKKYSLQSNKYYNSYST